MAEFAYEPEPEIALAPGESVREISGRSPWRHRRAPPRSQPHRDGRAGAVPADRRRQLRSRPLYANQIAHTDPFARTSTGTTVVDGKTVDVVQQGGGALGLGEIPIGPTWHSNYFLGADNQGRDVAARVLYGGRASLQIGIVSAVLCCFAALVLALRPASSAAGSTPSSRA